MPARSSFNFWYRDMVTISKASTADLNIYDPVSRQGLQRKTVLVLQWQGSDFGNLTVPSGDWREKFSDKA